MLPLHQYPYTDNYELNLDWVVSKIAELEKQSTYVITDTYDLETKSMRLDVKSLEV